MFQSQQPLAGPSRQNPDYDHDEIAIASGSSSSPTSVSPLPSDYDEEELVSVDNASSSSPVTAKSDNDSDNLSALENDDEHFRRILWQAIISNSYFSEIESHSEETDNRHEVEVANPGPVRRTRSRRRRRPRRYPSYLHYRHETPRVIPRPQNEWEQEDVAVHPQQQPEQELMVENLMQLESDDFVIFMNALYYTAVPAALTAVPLAFLLIIYCVVVPMQWYRTPEVLLCAVFIGIVTASAIKDFVTRPDYQMPGGSAQVILEKQIIQLLAICFIFPFGLWVQVFRMLKPFYEDYPSKWHHWLFIAFRYFMLGFTGLFTMDIPLTFHRMIKTNPVFGEILAFELVAHLVPVVYIAAPFFLMNFLATSVIPLQWQSLWLWSIIHLVAFSWISLILVGMAKYPEITVQRRYGLPGYLFMGGVTMVQGLLTAVFLIFLRLFYYVAMTATKQVVNLEEFEIFSPSRVGSFRYLEQIYRGQPPEEWRYLYPYPITFGFWTLIFCVVCQLRTLNLALLLLDYDQRLENIHLDFVEE